jgi:two-component system, OmpR family, response regulator
MTNNVLLLEDDIDLGQALAEHLEEHGYDVHWCKRLEQVRAYMRERPLPDVAVVDRSVPDGDAMQWIIQLRRDVQRLPVVVITAKSMVADRVAGLQAGADDYLVKPFDMDELLARISAVLRRTQPSTDTTLSVDREKRCAQIGSRKITLTAMEWQILACLARHPGRIYSRAEIEDALFEAGLGDANSNSLEVIIGRLRKKLGSACILNHRGMGYSFESAPKDDPLAMP